MCPTQFIGGTWDHLACPVCGMLMRLTDNDWPFCSPPCREIWNETAVLAEVGVTTAEAKQDHAA